MTAHRRALFVTPFAPTPPIEGHRKRMAATLAALKSLGYRVDLLFLALEHAWLDQFDAAEWRAMQAMADGFHFVRGAHPPRLEEGTYGVDDWWQPAFDDYAAWLFRNVAYELVLTNYVFTSRVLLHAKPAAVRIIDTHDLFADRRAMLEARGLRVEFFHCDRDGEAAGLARADLVLAIKSEEAAVFRGYGGPAVLTLPYVEPAQDAPAVVPAASPRFGYFASRNQINARNFLDFVAVAGAADLDLAAYGSICDVLADDGEGRFRRAGRVAAPADFYAAVDCVVVPQHFSTGLKIKVGEALAFGRPMICHAHAFEGFGEAPHPALACADFAEMAVWMRRFAAEPALAGELAAAVAAVQRRQTETVARGVAAIGRFVTETRKNVLLVVDGAALRDDPLYRVVVESVSGAFGDGWRAVLGAPGAGGMGDDPAPVGAATTLLAPADAASLGDPAACGYRFAAAIMLARGVAPPLGAAPVFYAPDIADYLAAMAGDVAPQATGATLHCRFSKPPAGVAAFRVAWLRWSPWFLEPGRDDGGHAASRELWVLCHAARAAEAAAMAATLAGRFGLQPRVFSADAGGAGAVYRDAFGRLGAPAGVVDLGDGRPVFALLREWLAMHHVPVLSLPLAGDAMELGNGLRAFLADASAARPAWRQRPPVVPGWAAAGWDRVVAACDPRSG